MRRSIKPWLIGAAIAVSGYSASSWLIGAVVQQRLQERERQVEVEAPYLTIARHEYHRGWFSSTEELTFEFAHWLPSASRSTFLPDPLTAPRLTIRSWIRHGPFPGLRTVGLATLHSELETPAGLRVMLQGALHAQPLASVDSHLGWLGGRSLSIASPAFQVALSGGSVLTWRGLSGSAESSASLRAVNGHFVARGLTLASETFKLELGELRMDVATHREFGRLNVGSVELGLASLRLEPNAAAAAPFSMSRISLSSHSSASGEYLDSQADFQAGNARFGAFTASDLGYAIAYRHVHGPTLAALIDGLQDAARGAAPRAARLGTAFGAETLAPNQQKLLEILRRDGVELLLHEPVIELSRIGFATPEGAFKLSARIAAPGLRRPDFAGSAPELAGVIQQHLAATADMRLDTSLLQRLLAQYPNRDALDGRLAESQRQGYLQREGSVLSTHFEFAAGRLSINHRPFPPSAH